MPGAGGTYLPPVVAQMTADKDDFVRAIAEMKAMLAALAKQATALKIVADARPFEGKIASLRAMVNAMKATIHVDADTLGALAKIEALKAATSGGGLGGMLGGMFSMGALGALLGLSGRGRSGGIGGGMGLWGMPGGFGAGLPAFGSLGSFAGFGMERFAMTGLGIAGSAVGGALGGGLLGMGALGSTAVGMGSDMMVAKSTIADTQAIAKAQDALNKAIAIYGPNSRQAAVAAAAYKYQLQLLGGAQRVGVAAEIALAAAVNNMNTIWDNSTQGARAAFVNNLAMPLVKVATQFIPLVASAAQRNFGIIGQALKPLWAFLGGPGMKIFTDLENVFAKRLPTSVGIIVQSLELLLKTIDHIATKQLTGGFLTKLLEFVTKLNTTGFDQLMGHVDKLIGMFHVWAAFVGALARVLIDVFSGSAQAGTQIIQSLTGMLNSLDKWLKSAQGKGAISNVFTAHKDQILALLQIIPPLIVLFGRIYLTLAPILTRVTIPLILIVLTFLRWVNTLKGGIGTFMQWLVGIGLIAAKLGLLNAPFNALLKWLANLTLGVIKFVVEWLAKITLMVARSIAQFALMALRSLASVAAMVAANIAGAAMVAAAWIAANAAMTLGIGLLVIVVVAGIILMITHWKQIIAWLGSVVSWVKQTYTAHQGLINIVLALLGPIGLLIKVVATVIDHWKQIVTWIGNAAKGISGFIGAIGNLMGVLGGLISKLSKVGDALNAINPFAKQSPSLVEQVAAGTAAIAGHYDTMADRIGAHASRAKGYMSAFAPGGMGGASGGGIGIGVGGGGGGNITVYSHPNITITGAAANDPQALSKELQKVLEKHTVSIVKALRGGAFAVPGQ